MNKVRRCEDCWLDVLAPALAGHSIRVVSCRDLDTAAREKLSAYFVGSALAAVSAGGAVSPVP